MSSDPLAKITPVNPSNVNKNMKPVDHSIGVKNFIFPP